MSATPGQSITEAVRLALERASAVERALRHVLDELYPACTRRADGRSPRAHARERPPRRCCDGDTAGNAAGSKRCALNAIVEFHDHHGPAHPDGAFVRSAMREAARPVRHLVAGVVTHGDTG